MAGDVDFRKVAKDVEIKDEKILLEWYDAMLQQGEMDNIPGANQEPRPMEIEIKRHSLTLVIQNLKSCYRRFTKLPAKPARFFNSSQAFTALSRSG